MANRTVKDAVTVKGTNPQYLVEKIIRTRIYDSRYWKEECFALSAELVVDKAMQLKYVGGIFGNNVKPTPFLCLVLKMLQIQPEKDIVVEFIKNEDYKYVRVLGAYYMRLTGTSLDCFKYVEPLLNDYRKLRVQNRQGEFELTYVDEFVDRLLHEERMCDVILPRIQRRQVHEENNELEPRMSALDDDLDHLPSDVSDDEDVEATVPGDLPPDDHVSSRHPRSSRHSGRHRHEHRHHSDDRHAPPSRSHRSDRHADHGRGRNRDVEYDRHRREPDRYRERERDRHRERERGRDRQVERRHRGEKRERRPHRHKERRKRRHSETDQIEVDEANSLRAKLGLPPLRP